MTLLIRQGLRPLEEMARQADVIAAGDLSRRVQPSEGNGEIARLGRALNGMLSQIETAFSQRALSEERLRSFLADASHELRTPLTSIRGYAELLRKDALGDEASRDRALSRIEREAARMGALVGDLGVLARQGEGPQPILGRVDLAAVAADVVADARTITADRPIEMTATGEVPVAGDAARIEQMVHNLVGNALSHTPGGTPVQVGVSVRGESAVLRVRDQGPGMTPAQASRVFDRFYRGNGDNGDGGSGLGLFIVATLARSLGGEATVDTALGQGATFEVRLPLYRPGGAGRPAGSTAGGGEKLGVATGGSSAEGAVVGGSTTTRGSTATRGSAVDEGAGRAQPGWWGGWRCSQLTADRDTRWCSCTGNRERGLHGIRSCPIWSTNSGFSPPTGSATDAPGAKPRAWPVTPTWSPGSWRSARPVRLPWSATAGPPGPPSCWPLATHRW